MTSELRRRSDGCWSGGAYPPPRPTLSHPLHTPLSPPLFPPPPSPTSRPPHQAKPPARSSAPTATTAVVAARLGGCADHLQTLDALSAMNHPTYPAEYLESVRPKEKTPVTLRDKAARSAVQLVRKAYDRATGYDPAGHPTEAQWLRRMIFLETSAWALGL